MCVAICVAIFVVPLFSVSVPQMSVLLFLHLILEAPFCLLHDLNLKHLKPTVNSSLPVKIFVNFVMKFMMPELRD